MDKRLIFRYCRKSVINNGATEFESSGVCMVKRLSGEAGFARKSTNPLTRAVGKAARPITFNLSFPENPLVRTFGIRTANRHR